MQYQFEVVVGECVVLQFVVVLGCVDDFDFIGSQQCWIWCDVFGQVYVEVLGGDCMVIFYVGVVDCYVWQFGLMGQYFGYVYGIGIVFVQGEQQVFVFFVGFECWQFVDLEVFGCGLDVCG